MTIGKRSADEVAFEAAVLALAERKRGLEQIAQKIECVLIGAGMFHPEASSNAALLSIKNFSQESRLEAAFIEQGQQKIIQRYERLLDGLQPVAPAEE